MTSKEFDARREESKHEQEVFDSLPEAIREALNACEEAPPKPSTVLATLLRGVSEESILTLLRRKKNEDLS